MKLFTSTILLALFALTQPQCVLRTIAPKAFHNCTYTFIHNPQKFPISLLSSSQRNVSIIFQSSYIPTYKADVIAFPGGYKLISLTITRSKLNAIEPGVLGSYAYLETASFDRNNISRLQSNMFKSKTLRYLNVSFNNISVIDSDAFNNVPLLLDLDLSHNNISELKSEYFKDVHFIRSLNLSSNSIKNLNALVVLSNLQELNLRGNFLEDINGLPATLEILDVSKNYLTKLKHSMFSQSNLKYLDVSSNGIKEIDWNVFRDLSLNKLSVTDNKIRHFNGTLRTKKIAIDGNIFNCDELIGLLQKFKIHDVVVETGGDAEKINVHGIACNLEETVDKEEEEEEEGAVKVENVTKVENVAKIENATKVENFGLVENVTKAKAENEQEGSGVGEDQLHPITLITSPSSDSGKQTISKSDKTDKEVLNEINFKISANLYGILVLLGLFVIANVAYILVYYFGYQIRYIGRNNQSSSKELEAIM